MTKRWIATLAAIMLCAATLRAAAPVLPEDLGPKEIDVSAYPEAYRTTYERIFVPAFKKWGTAARVINSPLVELDEKAERSERLAHPKLFADPQVAQPTRDGWKKYVEALYRRPACCGACPTLTLEQARALRSFLVYDSLARKTGAHADAWMKHRRSLIGRFRQSNRDQDQERTKP